MTHIVLANTYVRYSTHTWLVLTVGGDRWWVGHEWLGVGYYCA